MTASQTKSRRVRELLAHIALADKKILEIIEEATEQSPDFSSSFFKELPSLLRDAGISDLLTLLLVTHRTTDKE
ncbi:MAG: hypothetical protein JST83_08680 [Bacteroidetes bacterium]|nr:hypothetical protein [Bacteroidota bacterium]